MFILPRCLTEDYERFIQKYPFSKEAKQRIANIELSMLFDGDNVELILSQVTNVLDKGQVLVFDDPIKNLISHYGALLVVSQLPKRVWTRFADVESKYISNNLSMEVDRDCILYLAREFNIQARRLRELDIEIPPRLLVFYDVAVPVINYLKYAPKNDPNWKLINRFVLKGYVLLTYNDLTRLIEEAVEKTILEMLENLSNNMFVQDIVKEKLGEEFEKLLRKYTTRYTIDISASAASGDRTRRFPPCIEAILNDIKNGGNPSHIARFTLAAFLLRVLVEYEGKSIEEAVEEVVNVFRTVADFDEKKTRYQVMHIAGLVGGRKFYMPPNCDELISLGLCPVNGACKVKNPLVAYAKMLRQSRKRRKEGKKTTETEEGSKDSRSQYQAAAQGM